MEHNVKLYGTSTCVFCKVAKEFFEEEKIKYDYFDIGSDAETRDKVTQAAGTSSVPIIEIDGKYILGWKRSQVCKELGIDKY